MRIERAQETKKIPVVTKTSILINSRGTRPERRTAEQLCISSTEYRLGAGGGGVAQVKLGRLTVTLPSHYQIP